MKKLLLALLLLPTLAFADTMVAKSPDGSTTITLMQEPCTNKVARQLFEDNGLSADFKAVVVTKGKQYEACWTVNEEVAPGIVLIADESGDAGMISETAFHLEKSL